MSELSITSKVPKIADLYENTELSSKHNDLAILLNQEPKTSWLKQHPIATRDDGKGNKVPVLYMPIAVTEWLLTQIFVRWRPEVLDTKIMANSISVTVRVHYLDPITGTWDWTDGVGAAPIRTNRGASPTDFTQIQDSSIQTALPAAKSYAIKDAVECLGKIFGKDLNRADETNYNNLKDKFSNEPLNQ
jgi:hypothetical protein